MEERLGILIEQANHVLKGKIRTTPLEYSPELSQIAGHKVCLKLEHLQESGSFYIRGALYYLSTLSPLEKKRGVAACSVGNHGLGVATAAKREGIPSTIFVPQNVDGAKSNHLIQLGAKVIRSPFESYDETLNWAHTEAIKSGLLLIPAFGDEKIIAANGGTLATEVATQFPGADHVIIPAGKGSLAAGYAWQFKAQHPGNQVIIALHKDSPALQCSLEQGKAVTVMPPIQTTARAVEGGVCPQSFDILKTRVDQVALISEEEIKAACLWSLSQHQYLIEPAAALSLAAIRSGRVQINGPTALILTGRNVGDTTIKSWYTGD